MDGAQADDLYTAAARGGFAMRQRVGGRGARGEAGGARARVERALVQILVGVATIQVGPLKTEVEQGSMGTALGHG